MVLPLQAMKIMLLTELWLGPRLCCWMGDPKANRDICVTPESRLLHWHPPGIWDQPKPELPAGAGLPSCPADPSSQCPAGPGHRKCPLTLPAPQQHQAWEMGSLWALGISELGINLNLIHELSSCGCHCPPSASYLAQLHCPESWVLSSPHSLGCAKRFVGSIHLLLNKTTSVGRITEERRSGKGFCSLMQQHLLSAPRQLKSVLTAAPCSVW